MNIKMLFIIKKLSNHRVRRRLKIAITGFFGTIVLSIIFKIVYDVGYFNAQALKSDNNVLVTHLEITKEYAQRIVSGALKEDTSNPKTTVDKIIDNNQQLSTIIIKNNNVKRIAWIIDMRLFFIGDILNDEGYNLTKGIELQHDINRGNH